MLERIPLLGGFHDGRRHDTYFSIRVGYAMGRHHCLLSKILGSLLQERRGGIPCSDRRAPFVFSFLNRDSNQSSFLSTKGCIHMLFVPLVV